MPIQVAKSKPAQPHQEAADEMEAPATESSVSKATIEQGETTSYEHENESAPVEGPVSEPMERIEVGMAFRMPVAQYTMLEFTVRRSVPYSPLQANPDDVFESTHKWVEEKLNLLIAEQQEMSGES